jgi:hypothetical protein
MVFLHHRSLLLILTALACSCSCTCLWRANSWCLVLVKSSWFSYGAHKRLMILLMTWLGVVSWNFFSWRIEMITLYSILWRTWMIFWLYSSSTMSFTYTQGDCSLGCPHHHPVVLAFEAFKGANSLMFTGRSARWFFSSPYLSVGIVFSSWLAGLHHIIRWAWSTDSVRNLHHFFFVLTWILIKV